MVAEVRLAEADSRLAAGADLRRLRARKWAEELVSRAGDLPEPDRALIHAVSDQGLPVTRIATESGQSVRALRRRVRTLATRITSPQYRLVILYRRRWSRTRRAVGTICFLDGRSQREAARELGLSLYTVRKHHAAIMAMCEVGGS